ncbi:superoxide dismutase [Actinoplanes sp. NPDC051859]|uniref:superoxide dismutase n=1 Tax=Actinoplanes sp. NPDC051859 TaxID=3363909 RepID=UPI0037BA17B9
MRRTLPFLTVALAALAGCSAPGSSSFPTTPVSPPPAGTPWIVSSGIPDPDAPHSGQPMQAQSEQAPLTVGTASGIFQPQGTQAITYDTAVVPAGATAQVSVSTTAQGVRVRLAVTGLASRRAYGAHLHTKTCTSVPDDAGPHYQHQVAPSQPSTDPAYANPRNEVWLDFTTDPRGAATVASQQPWSFDPIRPPRSLILHAQLTRTDAGQAGTAGARVACLTLRS